RVRNRGLSLRPWKKLSIAPRPPSQEKPREDSRGFKVSLPARRGSDALDDRGDTLAAADAQRDETVRPAGALDLGQGLDGQDRPGRADRMPEGHRAAVGVHLLRVHPELF